MDIPLENLEWETIVENAGESLYIADLGCGEAEYHETLLQASKKLAGEEDYNGDIKIYGIEASEEKVEEARSNNPGENFAYVQERLEPGDSYTPVDGEFDVVVSQHILCDSDNPDEISEEADRLGKDSGYNSHHTTC